VKEHPDRDVESNPNTLYTQSIQAQSYIIIILLNIFYPNI